MMAPPTTPVTISQPISRSDYDMRARTGGGKHRAYNWTEVPAGSRCQFSAPSLTRAAISSIQPQGTIVVPFANQNLYVMKFGQSYNGGMYFINNGQYPTFYLPAGRRTSTMQPSRERTGTRSRKTMPIRSLYMSVLRQVGPHSRGWAGIPACPTTAATGATVPYSMIGPMVGLHFLIGGSPYYGWNSYHSYYYSGHPYGASSDARRQPDGL